MAVDLHIGSVFVTDSNKEKKVVLDIHPDDEGGMVSFTLLDRDTPLCGECRICNMIPAGELTVEEMLTSPNKFIQKMGMERSLYRQQ